MEKVGIKTISNDGMSVSISAYTHEPDIAHITIGERGGPGGNPVFSAELPLIELKRMIESVEETVKEAE